MASNNEDEAEFVSTNASSTLSGDTKVRANHGVFLFENFQIIAEPGHTIDVSVVSKAIDNTKAAKA